MSTNSHSPKPGTRLKPLGGAAPKRVRPDAEIARLRARLDEAEQLIDAIRNGEVDAFVVHGQNGEQVYSLGGVERIYRVVVETMHEAALTVSPAGVILFANGQFARMVRLSGQEVVGRSLPELIEPSHRPDFEHLITQAQWKPARKRLLLKAGDGPGIPVQFSGTPLVTEAGQSICLVVTDLTGVEASADFIRSLERHKTELESSRAKLAESEARFRLLSETAAQLLASEDPQRVVYDLAHRIMAHLDCQAFFNFLMDEAGGRLRLNACAGIPDDARAACEWLDLGSAICGCVARDQARIVAGDILNTTDPRADLVRSFGIQAYCCHPLKAEGRLIGTLSFGTRTRPEFTTSEIELMRTVADQVAVAMQRVQAKQALENTVRERTAALAASVEQLDARARQLRALAGELTMAEQRERRRMSKLLHDGLQQHLAAAKLQVGGLPEPQADVRAIAAGLDELLAECIRMSRTLSAELSPPALFEHGLRSSLEWLCRWMKEKHGFTVELAMEGNFELAEDVKILVFEFIRELLFNSAKHSGGKTAAVQVGGGKGSNLWIRVSDSGRGFETKELESTANGEALGLFGIRERIGLIGGTLQVDSAPGRGCRFDLTVPSAVVLPPRQAVPFSGVNGRTAAGAIRVLVADDHPLFRAGLVRLFRKEGDFQVVGQAESGRQAIEMAGRLLPEVILMDVNMPELDGIEATAAIHRAHPDIRIIGLSMHEDEHSMRSMLNAGAVDYKTKGCNSRELLAAIRACTQLRDA